MSQPDFDQLLQAIRALPRPDRLRLVERVVHELAEEARGTAAGAGHAVLGMFADDAELMDQICELAMTHRER
jgi:hypothetical protein